MANIFPAPQRQPSFSERLGNSVGGGIGAGLNKGVEYAKEFGLERLKQEGKKKEEAHIQQGVARESIAHMRDILEKGNTGWNFFNMATEEGRGDRAALDTAALNLERLAADMVGKGTLSMNRFEYLKKRLPSGWKSDAENRQILDEWDRILSSEGGIRESSGKKGKVSFDMRNPEHKAKAEQLHKKFKDKERVRKELKREFEGLDAE